VFPELTAAENVRTATHLWAVRNVFAALWRTPQFCRSEAAIARAVEDRLALVGLTEQRDVPAGTLSYGDQRRLEVAVALATGARLLLLDEPAAGLNAAETDELCALVRRLKAAGFTVVVIEHDMRMVMSLCDRIVVLNHGALIFDGTPEMAVTDAAVIDAYLGTGTAHA
jgi:branched-chain amino acid transport system ATP-binding protein